MAARALLLALTAASLSSAPVRRRGIAAMASASAAAASGAPTDTNAADPPAPPAYASAGPCPGPPIVIRGSLITSNTQDKLAMTLTLPGGSSGDGRRAPPWPVVAFFNGFQVREAGLPICCLAGGPFSHGLAGRPRWPIYHR